MIMHTPFAVFLMFFFDFSEAYDSFVFLDFVSDIDHGKDAVVETIAVR
jgi:hypothetical protein